MTLSCLTFDVQSGTKVYAKVTEEDDSYLFVLSDGLTVWEGKGMLYPRFLESRRIICRCVSITVLNFSCSVSRSELNDMCAECAHSEEEFLHLFKTAFSIKSSTSKPKEPYMFHYKLEEGTHKSGFRLSWSRFLPTDLLTVCSPCLFLLSIYCRFCSMYAVYTVFKISLGSITVTKVPDGQLMEAHQSIFDALFALIKQKTDDCSRLESENAEEKAAAEISLKVCTTLYTNSMYMHIQTCGLYSMCVQNIFLKKLEEYVVNQGKVEQVLYTNVRHHPD